MSHTKLGKMTLILLVSAIIVSVVSIPTNSTQNTSNVQFLHSSAYSLNQSESLIITNNTVLDSYCINGTGTREDPHIFEDYIFNYALNDTAILISENVTEYFIIRNCTIINNQTEAKGIGITMMSNVGIIENCTITNTLDGIHLEGNNHFVNDTKIDADQFGIYAKDSTNLTITLTQVIGVSYGFSFHYCDNLTIQYNSLSTGTTGIQLYSCTNFDIKTNIIGGFSTGILIVESPPKMGSVNMIVGNVLTQNEKQAQLITDDCNTMFYDESTQTGNLWDDWRGWGKYKTGTGVVDLYPMEIGVGLDPNNPDIRDLELTLAPKLPFKLWFWIFAPTLVGLGIVSFFIYWKLIMQPKSQ